MSLAPNITLPAQPETVNIRALASWKGERFVPANGATTFALSKVPSGGLEMIYKNGLLLDQGATPPAYTISGAVVTLNVAANGTDVFIVRYYYKASS